MKPLVKDVVLEQLLQDVRVCLRLFLKEFFDAFVAVEVVLFSKVKFRVEDSLKALASLANEGPLYSFFVKFMVEEGTIRDLPAE